MLAAGGYGLLADEAMILVQLSVTTNSVDWNLNSREETNGLYCIPDLSR